MDNFAHHKNCTDPCMEMLCMGCELAKQEELRLEIERLRGKVREHFEYGTRLEEERDLLREALKAVEFSKWVLQDSVFEGCYLDAGDAQDKAEKLGLIVPVIATDENSDLWDEFEGTEVGDQFFMFVDWVNRAPIMDRA